MLSTFVILEVQTYQYECEHLVGSATQRFMKHNHILTVLSPAIKKQYNMR